MKRISIIIFSIFVMSALFSSCSEKDAAVITTQKQSTSSVSETISAKPKSTTNNHVETKPKTTATTSTTAVSKAVTTHNSPSTTKRHTTTTQKSQSKARSTSERKTTSPKSHCTNNNNHSIACGNMGRWFSSRSDVEKYWEQVDAKYFSQYEKGEITWDEYVSKSPVGYEAWSCSYCGKWTGNFTY